VERARGGGGGGGPGRPRSSVAPRPLLAFKATRRPRSAGRRVVVRPPPHCAGSLAMATRRMHIVASGGGVMAGCVGDIRDATDVEARARLMADVRAAETMQRLIEAGVELESGDGAWAVERGWQPGRLCGLDIFRAPCPSLSLPSNGPELWRQRVSGWGDSLAGIDCFSIHFLCSIYAWPCLFKPCGSRPQATPTLTTND
jgi:hypothetical protein